MYIDGKHYYKTSDMKKETIVSMMLIFTLQGNAQEMAMCTYDAAGNRLSRFTYTDSSRSSRGMAKNDNNLDMANDRLGNHTIHVSYNSAKCILTIEILGLDDSDQCSVSLYNMTGQLVMSQNIVTSPAEMDISDISNGVYILRLALNGENRCWKILKK